MKKITFQCISILGFFVSLNAQVSDNCIFKDNTNKQFVSNQNESENNTLVPTNYPLKEYTTEQFVAVQLPTTDFDKWATTTITSNDIQNLSQQLYGKYKDDFDFIFFVYDEAQARTNQPLGKFLSVSNSISGIGLNRFNNSSLYGSAGRLKGTMLIYALNYIENGPFLHEMAHNWANHAIKTVQFLNNNPANGIVDFQSCGTSGLDNCATNVYTGHWGISGCGGQLGGFDQSSLVAGIDGISNKYKPSINGGSGFGFNANGGNTLKYSDYELYLMGLKPLSAVAPFDVFTSVTILNSDAPNRNWNGKFIGNSKIRYDNQKITQDLGVRNPSSTTSQKDFKALIVVLTTQNVNTFGSSSVTIGWPRNSSYLKKDFMKLQLEAMSKKGDNGISLFNFWEATQGLGTLSFDLSTSQLSIVDNEFKNALQIYPNPVKNSFQIHVEDEGVFQIYGLEGKLVSEQKVIVGDQKIDMTHLSKGLYIGKLGRKSVKIIKE